MQDLKDIGLNQATVSTLGCVVTILLGSYGQLDQIKKIWRNKSVEKISGLMTMVMFTLFASYLVRGLAEQRVMFLVQGIFRTILMIAIIVGIIRFGNAAKKNVAGLFVGLGVLAVMSVHESWRLDLFSWVLYAGAIGAAHQAWNIRRANGQVSFVNYTTSLLSVSFQSWYAWYYNDMALLKPCLCFVAVYITILILMARNVRK